MFSRLHAFAALAIMALAPAGMTHAETVPAPGGPVILTVTGAPQIANVGAAVQFDRDSFAALGFETIETTTIWTDGVQRFEGVPLVTLVDLMGVEGGTLLATAINDYAVEIPVTDAVAGGPIIAIMRNGEEMSVRDKGPLWIVYPYDTSARYRTEVIYSRSIWQLDRIDVVQ